MDLKDIYNMFEYFHFNKGDVERWCAFEEAEVILKEEDSELILKYYEMKSATIDFETLLKSRYSDNPIE